MNWYHRLLAVLLVIGLVGAMGAHYDSVFDDRWPYPETENLKTTPAEHDGDRVFVFGTVQGTDDSTATATIEIDSDEGPFTAEVTRFEATVQPGGTVQVVGTYHADGGITAETVRVVNPAGASNLYKYGTSAAGALLVLALFFRYWRVNIRELHFERRSDG